MSKILIMVGNIGSGKTTWIKKFLKKTKEKYVVMSRDDIRYMIGGGTYVFDLELEPAVWESEKQIIKTFMKLGINIIVDEVGVSPKMRKRYIKLANQFKYKKYVIKLPYLSQRISVNRRMKNPHQQPNRKLWEDVWTKFDKVYDYPNKKEGFHQVIPSRFIEYTVNL